MVCGPGFSGPHAQSGSPHMLLRALPSSELLAALTFSLYPSAFVVNGKETRFDGHERS